jgi:hypothetical protein
VRFGADKAVPDIEDCLDLGRQHIFLASQGPQIVLAEQERLQQQFELIQADRRARYGVGSIGVAGNAAAINVGVTTHIRATGMRPFS